MEYNLRRRQRRSNGRNEQTDLHMPGVGGLELLEQVRTRHPETRLILMTAHGPDKVEAEARCLEVYRYLTKPFEIEKLIEATRCIDSGSIEPRTRRSNQWSRI